MRKDTHERIKCLQKQIEKEDSSVDINKLVKDFVNLKEITIHSNKYTIQGNRIFYIENSTLCSIPLPSSLKTINQQEVKPLTSLEIPTNVTKLGEYCFSGCEKLKEIQGLENIQEFGKGCFFDCPELYDFDNPIFKSYKPKTEYEMISVFQREQVDSVV